MRSHEYILSPMSEHCTVQSDFLKITAQVLRMRWTSNLLGEGLLLPLLPSSADMTRLPPISSLSRKRESCDPVAAWLRRLCAGGDGEGDEAAVVDAGERLLVILRMRERQIDKSSLGI